MPGNACWNSRFARHLGARFRLRLPTQFDCWILRELVVIFLAAALVLTAFFLSAGSFREALPQSLSLGTILRLTPYVALDALRYAIPAAFLLAINVTYGHMAFHNELLALQAAGVTPLRALLPGLHLAAFLCLPTVWLTDLAVSWGHDGVQRVVRSSVQQFVEATLRTQRSYSTEHFSLAVARLDGSQLVQPLLMVHPAGAQQPLTITAQRARLFTEPDRAVFGVEFREGEVQAAEHVVYHFPDKHTVSFSLDEVNRASRDEHYSLRELRSKIAESGSRLRALEREYRALAAASAESVSDTGTAEPEPSCLAQVTRALEQERERYAELCSKPHRRWAHGLSCFAFAMFGIPWATRCRHGDIYQSFLLGFLPILLFYYPIEMLLASNSRMPSWSIWIADGTLILCGCALQFWPRRGWLKESTK